MRAKINRLIYSYRYDLFSLSFIFLLILWIFFPLLKEGHIVFSDLDFPLDSKTYPEEILGLWNDKWNTSTLLNLPRVFCIALPWLVSALMDYSGPVFIKTFILSNVLLSGLSIYLFIKRIVSVYLEGSFNFFKLFAITTGALFYAVNPWVIFRIQHIYLLCGYALLPLALLFFFNAFDPKFQSQLIKGYSVSRKRLYRRNILDLALLSATISIMSAAIHYFFYTVFLLGFLWVLLILKQLLIHRESRKFSRTIIYNFFSKGVLLAVLAFIFCYYWLSIYLGSILIDAQPSQHNINVVDTLSLFSRNSQPLNVLFLISYWWPMFDLNTLPLSFYAGGGILLVLILTGVIFFVWKRHILLFLFLLSFFFQLLATGTRVPGLAELFIFIVMKIPFFGNMFRDPNKLIGIVCIGYSVILVFGIEKLFTLPLKRPWLNNSVRILLFLLITGGYLSYIGPFRDKFIMGFYHPVQVPGEFTELQESYSSEDGRVLHFPISASMLQPSTGVTTPEWNTNPDNFGELKATGDFIIYQSQKDTIFHHEGSDPAIGYYFNFLQYLLDNGLTHHFGKYLAPLGINEFSWAAGFTGQEERQGFNLNILKGQKDLEITWKGDLFTLFSLKESVSPSGVRTTLIYTPKGFQALSSYHQLPGFTYDTSGVLFTAQKKGNILTTIRKGDYIDSITSDELFLSSLPKKYYLSPAQQVKNGNPFLSWSQSAIHTDDWLWHLKSQNILPLRFDMGFESGIALSFSSVKLDIPVHSQDRIRGRQLLDFETFLYNNYIFISDDSELFQVQAYPFGNENQTPLVHGVISRGQNYDIWQVAKSAYIPADPLTPYQFNMTISGQGANKLHLKARFYDKDKNEIATAYILTPEEKINFEYFRFYGEYITPRETAFVRMDLLSLQRPEQKVYWWLHDFSIHELSEYTVPNTIDMVYTPRSRENLKVWLRTFHSPVAGDLRVKINEEEFLIQGKKEGFSGFTWTYLGEVSNNGTTFPIVIENLTGFNAVNEMVLITPSEYKEQEFLVNQAVKKAGILTTMEAEYDFDFQGPLQSQRGFTELSMAGGRSAHKGVLKAPLDILKNGNYTLSLGVMGEEGSRIRMTLKGLDKKQPSYKESFTIEPAEPAEEGLFTETLPPKSKGYIKKLKPHDSSLVQNYQIVESAPLTLSKGPYELTIELDYKKPSLLSIKDLGPFDPGKILIPDFTEGAGGSCIPLMDDMMVHSINTDKLKISYEETCSNDWYITSSPLIPVKRQEYLILLKMRSEVLKERHSKILYLNERYQVIKTDYIPEVEERKKELWNSYEYISQAPSQAAWMIFQIWGQGEKEKKSVLEMKDLILHPFENLPGVDRVWITDQKKELFPGKDSEPTEYTRREKESMSRKFTLNNPQKRSTALSFDISPHPLWQLVFDGEVKKMDYSINGLKTLFFTKGNNNGEVRTALKEHYFLGLFLWPLGIVLVVFLYFNAKNPLPFKERFRRYDKKAAARRFLDKIPLKKRIQ